MFTWILYALVLVLVCLHPAFSETITSCLRKRDLPQAELANQCYRFRMRCDADQFIHIRTLHFNVVTRHNNRAEPECCTNEVECLDEYSRQDMYEIYSKCSGRPDCGGVTQLSSLDRLANPDMKCEDDSKEENEPHKTLFVASTTMQYDCIEASSVVDMCSNVQKTVGGSHSVLHLMYRHGRGQNNYAPSSCTCILNSQDDREADVMVTEEDVRLHRYSNQSGPSSCSSARLSILGQQSSKSTKCAGNEPIDSFQTRHVTSNPIGNLKIVLDNMFHVGDKDEPNIIWLSIRIENGSTGQLSCTVGGPTPSPDPILAGQSGDEPPKGLPVYVIIILVLGFVILGIGIIIVVIRIRRKPKQTSNSSAAAADNAGLDNGEYSSDISEYAEIPRHPSLYTTIQEVSERQQENNMAYETTSPDLDGIQGQDCIDRDYEIVDSSESIGHDEVNESENVIKLPPRDMYAHVNKGKKKAKSIDNDYNRLNDRTNEHKTEETGEDASHSYSGCYNALDSADDQYNKIDFKSSPRRSDPTYSHIHDDNGIAISTMVADDKYSTECDVEINGKEHDNSGDINLPSRFTASDLSNYEQPESIKNGKETHASLELPSRVKAPVLSNYEQPESIKNGKETNASLELPSRVKAPALSNYEQPESIKNGKETHASLELPSKVKAPALSNCEQPESIKNGKETHASLELPSKVKAPVLSNYKQPESIKNGKETHASLELPSKVKAPVLSNYEQPESIKNGKETHASLDLPSRVNASALSNYEQSESTKNGKETHASLELPSRVKAPALSNYEQPESIKNGKETHTLLELPSKVKAPALSNYEQPESIKNGKETHTSLELPSKVKAPALSNYEQPESIKNGKETHASLELPSKVKAPALSNYEQPESIKNGKEPYTSLDDTNDVSVSTGRVAFNSDYETPVLINENI